MMRISGGLMWRARCKVHTYTILISYTCGYSVGIMCHPGFRKALLWKPCVELKSWTLKRNSRVPWWWDEMRWDGHTSTYLGTTQVPKLAKFINSELFPLADRELEIIRNWRKISYISFLSFFFFHLIIRVSKYHGITYYNQRKEKKRKRKRRRKVDKNLFFFLIYSKSEMNLSLLERETNVFIHLILWFSIGRVAKVNETNAIRKGVCLKMKKRKKRKKRCSSFHSFSFTRKHFHENPPSKTHT